MGSDQASSEETKLSIGKAAKHLGVSIDTLRRWEKKNRIKAYRSPGGHRYFEKSELDDLFGKKYTRDEPTKPYSTQSEKVEAPTSPTSLPLQTTNQAPGNQTSDPVESTSSANKPIQIPPQTQPQIQTQTVQINPQSSVRSVVARPEVQISPEDKERLKNIFSTPSTKNGQKKYSFFTRLLIVGLVIFSLVDIILVAIYLTSPSLITPLP